MKKDYSNKEYREPDVDFMIRSLQPRMPWHDVACCVEGPAVTDFARHFVQRYNYESGAEHLLVNLLVHPNIGYGICRYHKKNFWNCLT